MKDPALYEHDERITIPSDVHLILLYPHHYKRIISNGKEIYVEDFMRCGKAYDKHFWVPASEVDEWIKKLAEEKSNPSTGE